MAQFGLRRSTPRVVTSTGQRTYTQADWISESSRRRGSRGGYDTASIEDPYRQEAYVHGCLRILQNGLAAIPPMGWKTNDEADGEELPEDNPHVRLWRGINPLLSPRDFMERLALYTNLVGEAILVFTDEAGEPVPTTGKGIKRRWTKAPSEVWIFPGGEDYVSLEYDRATGFPTRWGFPHASRGTRWVDYWSTIMVGFPSTRNLYRGMAPMEAAIGPAAQSYATHLYLKRRMERGGSFDGVLSLAETLDQNQFEQVKFQIDEEWNSNTAPGGVRLVNASGTFQPVAASARDLQSVEMLNASRSEIAFAFGVPEALVASNAANYATFKGEWRRLWVLTLIPQADRIIDRIRKHYLFRHPDGIVAAATRGGLVAPSSSQPVPYFDISDIEALQGELSEQAAAASQLQKMGVPLATALFKSGIELDPFEGDDVALIQGSWTRLDDVVEGIDSVSGFADDELDPEGAGDQAATTEDDDAPPDDAADDAASDTEKSLELIAEAREAEEIEREASVVTTREERLEYWRMVEGDREAGDAAIKKASQKWINGLGRIQREHLRKLGSKGFDGDAVARDSIFSPVLLSSDALTSFGRAMDREEPTERPVRDCSGKVIGTEFDAPTEHELRWLRARSGLLQRYTVDDLRAAVYAQRAGVRLSDVERLIAIAAPVLAKPYGKDLFAAYLRIFEEALEAHASESGLSGEGIASVSKRLERIMRGKAIKVSEGVQSRLAQRVRASYLKILRNAPGVGTKPFAQLLKEQLASLETTTAREFRTASRRAIRISRTETAAVDNRARWEQSKALVERGLATGNDWITAGGGPPPAGRVRPAHYERDGTFREVGDVWASASGPDLRFPGDSNGSAEEVIHCRCTIQTRPIETNQDEADA